MTRTANVKFENGSCEKVSFNNWLEVPKLWERKQNGSKVVDVQTLPPDEQQHKDFWAELGCPKDETPPFVPNFKPF